MFNLFNRINFASGPGAVNSDGTITDDRRLSTALLGIVLGSVQYAARPKDHLLTAV